MKIKCCIQRLSVIALACVLISIFENHLLGQTIITPIDGNTTNTNNGVIYGWASGSNNHSLYQHIYKQSLINQSGAITHIEFENQMTGTFTNVSIYLGETTKNNFTGGTDWVNTGLTLVYTGNLNIVNGWYQIELSTPFNYTNTNNLILAVHQNGGSTPNSSSARHIVGTSDPNVTIRNFSTSSYGTYPNWDGGFGNRFADLPSLKLIFASNCNAQVLTTSPAARCGPGSLELQASVNTDATVRWFNEQTAGALLGIGNTFTTPSITESTIYWVEAFNSNENCSSSRIAVTATINEIPLQPVDENCWDNYVFNSVNCSWENIGEEPQQPQTECYETATFNETNCVWDVVTTLSNSVIQSNNILTAEQQNVNYQWIDCATNLPIANAIGQTFTPTSSGSYAVQLSDASTNCTRQSDCIPVTVLSVITVETQKFAIYPNPAKEKIQIRGANLGDQVEIISINGQILHSQIIKHTEEQIVLSNLSPALYFLKVKASNDETMLKLIIQ